MKELIKNIKYNRFPKEVLLLIKILNENIDNKNNPNFTIKAPNGSFLFNIYDSKTIAPYYYNIYIASCQEMISQKQLNFQKTSFYVKSTLGYQ